MDLPGFVLDRPVGTPDRPAQRLVSESPSTGMTVSTRLEKVAVPIDAAGCRSLYAASLMQSPLMKGVEVGASQSGAVASLAYVVNEVSGTSINQRHVNAFLAREDVCLDLHLSKVQFKPGEEGLFDAVVKTLAIDRP